MLGICNGFQVLCEAGLLPGVLRPNHHGRFVCRDVDLVVERAGSPWLAGPRAGRCPAHPGQAPRRRLVRAARGARARRGRAARSLLRYADNPNGALARRRLRHERGRQRVRADAAPRARGGRGARADRRATAARGPALAGSRAPAHGSSALDGRDDRRPCAHRLSSGSALDGGATRSNESSISSSISVGGEAAVERHRDPVALVHVVARGDRGVLGAQRARRARART